MKRLGYILSLLTLALTFHLNAAYTRIISREARHNLISTAESLVSEDSIRFDDDISITLADSPFGYEEVESGIEDALADTNKPTAQEATQPELADTDFSGILKVISKSIKPTGSVTSPSGLSLAFGKHLIKDGGSIVAKYKNKRFTIYIENITDNTYTLRLKDASIERDLDPPQHSLDPDSALANLE